MAQRKHNRVGKDMTEVSQEQEQTARWASLPAGVEKDRLWDELICGVTCAPAGKRSPAHWYAARLLTQKGVPFEEHDLEDIVSLARLSLVKYCHAFRPNLRLRHPVRAYVAAATRNAARDWLQSGGRSDMSRAMRIHLRLLPLRNLVDLERAALEQAEKTGVGVRAQLTRFYGALFVYAEALSEAPAQEAAQFVDAELCADKAGTVPGPDAYLASRELEQATEAIACQLNPRYGLVFQDLLEPEPLADYASQGARRVDQYRARQAVLQLLADAGISEDAPAPLRDLYEALSMDQRELLPPPSTRARKWRHR